MGGGGVGGRRLRDNVAVNQIGRPTCSRKANPSVLLPSRSPHHRHGPGIGTWMCGKVEEGGGTLLLLNPKTETLMYQAQRKRERDHEGKIPCIKMKMQLIIRLQDRTSCLEPWSNGGTCT